MSAAKEDYIAYRIAKSDEVFADEALLALNNRWNSCVNRLYYSSFYLVSALLYRSGIKADMHNGAKTQFFQHFVKTGAVPAEQGKLYTHLFDWRQESDYADFIEFDGPTIKPMLEKVSAFNLLLKSLIKK